jgi:hypothetical protein
MVVVLTTILDWEFAGWGDPDEDIGWFCCRSWRFARLDRETRGDRRPHLLYGGYESQSRRPIDPKRVFFWEVLTSVRWGIIAFEQTHRHIIGDERDLDLAFTGRRATECEPSSSMTFNLIRPGWWSGLRVTFATAHSKIRRETGRFVPSCGG